MKKFTKELGPGWITLVENDDYALCRLIFGDGLEVDCDEEETPLLKKGFQQIQEYWTGHRVIFTLPLAPGGSDFEREVWETVIRIPYGEHFTTPTLLAALALEDTEENRARVIKAVDEYQDLLRITVASPGNDHRLGANEAPPAIVSMFLGDELTGILNAIEEDRNYSKRAKCVVEIGVHVLPRLPQDSTDRNRTSPFAFTGNKFEFRMPGSSQSIADINTVLNTIVAEELSIFADRLEACDDLSAGVKEIVKDTLKEHKRIIFNGNNYSDEWVAEAERRGLMNLKTTVDALPHLTDRKNVALFAKHGIFTETELASRKEISLENYAKVLHIEALTALDMVRKAILPAINRYMGDLAKTANQLKELGVAADTGTLSLLSARFTAIGKEADRLEEAVEHAEKQCGLECAAAYRDEVIPAMERLREAVDGAELITAKEYWPFPSYGDILYYL